MTDEASAQAGASICPWCSAALPTPAPEACPSCGARLVAEGEGPVPGVTAIDAEAVLRSARATTRSRGGLLSWFGGPDDSLAPPPPQGALEPPSPAVLEEMRRMAFEAELASLEAEVREIQADQAVAALSVENEGPEGASVEAVADAPPEADAPPAAHLEGVAAPASSNAEPVEKAPDVDEPREAESRAADA